MCPLAEMSLAMTLDSIQAMDSHNRYVHPTLGPHRLCRASVLPAPYHKQGAADPKKSFSHSNEGSSVYMHSGSF